MNYSIEFDRERYVVTLYYTSRTIPWQRAIFYRADRNAVKHMARFIRDNSEN